MKMEGINTVVQKALKADRIKSRPHGSTGTWAAFLLPAAVIVSSLRAISVSELYKCCAVYSFNTFLNILHLLLHIKKYQSINVTKEFNILCVIPVVVTFYLYTQFLNLEVKTSLCYSVANALLYFEGIPFLLKAFPKTFTFGEGNIIVQGLSLFIYSLFLRLNNILLNGPPNDEYNVSTVILQLALSWIIVFCIVPFTHSSLRKFVPVYIWTFTTLALIYFSVFGLLKIDLLIWIWMFLTKPERMGIIALWMICSATAIVIVQQQINNKKKSNTILRKYFHVLAVIVFLSGILLDVTLIYFSSACILGLFIILEVFRILKLPPLYKFLQGGFSAYCDEKDSGVLAMTPICLLVGTSLPLWLRPLESSSDDMYLQLLSGVMSIGIGDTFASIGGKLFGKHKWEGSQKTIEGTVFCILSQIIFVQALVSFGFLHNSFEVLIKGSAVIFITSIVEAKTDQIDNLVLPLIMYTLLMV